MRSMRFAPFALAAALCCAASGLGAQGAVSIQGFGYPGGELSTRALGMGGGKIEESRGREVIEQNGVGMFQNPTALAGEQFRIAGPRANEMHAADGRRFTHVPSLSRKLRARSRPICRALAIGPVTLEWVHGILERLMD